MKEVETIEKKVVEVKKATQTLEETERQTIVHCKHFLQMGDGLRIWKTTYLIEHPSGKKRKLLHAERISMYPEWTIMDKTGAYQFTLYFEGLSKSCTSFDLIEEIPQPGGFEYKGIPRNQTDVYRIILG